MTPTFQSASAPPRAASQGQVGNPAPQNGAPAPTTRPYTQPVNAPRTHSLPVAGTVPTRPVAVLNYTPPHLVNGTQQSPRSPQPPTAPQSQAPVIVQSAPVPSPPTPATQPPADEIDSPVLGAAPPEEQDWDLDINWDELEALDRSEWQANDSIQIEDQNAPLDSTPIIVETNNEQPSRAPVDASSAGVEVEPGSIDGKGTLIELAVGKSSGRAPSTRPEKTTPDASKSEVDNSATQQLNSLLFHEPVHALEHPQSPAEDVIDIDELPGDEALGSQARKPIPTGDDEMEVDELDPTEPPGSIRLSEQPDDTSTVLPSQPSTTLQPVPILDQRSVNVLNSLPPHVRAEIRQKAKEPLISHYISITSKTREAAEARFQEMSDQEVFDLYDKMGHARRIVDHYKNMLAQSSHKIHLPHIDVREPPPEPPTLLSSVTGAIRLSSETIEFSISQEMMASLGRWRARFVTPAGSHGDLVTVELACYPKDAFRPSEDRGRRELAPNARTRTWPDGGILWAFINSEDELKDRNVRLFLSPPPFVELNQPVDISDFIREGRNTVKFVHLGGMEHFIFAVQTRRMPPPHLTWPGVLKRIQSIDPSANGYSALINRISVMLEER
ncbi:hypothetical protein B0J17DRAFT_262352 [Rhizoctonia solani]|nr:hypothetical protein B0J17DRAFT_262352 [Rhizoctonia solani]